MTYPKDIMNEVLYTEEEIRKAANELAKRINEDYNNKDLVLVCTLKGAVPFFSELIKGINIHCNMEFIKASSYIGNTTTTIGNVQISTIMNFPVENKEVIIVEDIVDTGITLNTIVKLLKHRGANSVEIACLLNKEARRVMPVDVKYSGFEVPDEFVIGYGLDYNEMYRNLPYVGVLKEEVYQRRED